MFTIFYVLPFLVQILYSSCAAVPETKCKISDSQCLKSAAQAFLPIFVSGFPEIKVEPTDVMNLKTMKVDLSGLNLAMRDVQIRGLKKAVIDTISLDPSKKQMKLIFHTDFVLKSKYKASGQLLILPISGDGNADFKIKNLEIDYTFQYDVVKNTEGKDVVELKSFSYNYDFKDGAHFELTNLFNGNKALSDTMHQFMNENWKALTLEFGRPLLDSTNKAIFKAVKNFLKSKPLEELADI